MSEHPVVIEVLSRLKQRPTPDASDKAYLTLLSDAEKALIIDYHQALYQADKKDPVARALMPVIPDLCQTREITQADLDADPKLYQMLEDGELVHKQSKETIRANRCAPGEATIVGTPRTLEQGVVFDKHCYGLFPPGSNKPVSVIYAKLSSQSGLKVSRADNLPQNVREYLDFRTHIVDTRMVDSATFYSVSNFGGIRGVPFGKTLIEGAVTQIEEYVGQQQLSRYDKPRMRYCTLSPVRTATEKNNFIPWLRENRLTPKMLTSDEVKLIRDVQHAAHEYGGFGTKHCASNLNARQALVCLADMLEVHTLFGPQNTQGSIIGKLHPHKLERFDRLVEDLALDYALSSNASPDPSKFKAIDDAASFHWGNGAAFGDVHARANNTQESCQQSGGVMFNHLYEDEMMDSRAEAHRRYGLVFVTQKIHDRFKDRMEALGRDLEPYDARIQQISASWRDRASPKSLHPTHLLSTPKSR